MENSDIEPQTHAQLRHYVTRLAQRMDSIRAETVERNDASISETISQLFVSISSRDCGAAAISIDTADMITEFRRTNPRGIIPETTVPGRYVLTQTEDNIIDAIL